MLPTIPDDLMQFLRNEEQRAKDTALDEARSTAIKAYHGDKYGDEEEGRSQAVTRDVSEVVDFMLVGVLGTLTAGGKAVEFDTEPEEVETGEQDAQGQPKMRRVDYGAEATAAVHYQFMRRQKGYRILHDAGKAGMLEKTGIVKTYVEQRYVAATLEAPRAAISDDGTELEGLPVIASEPIYSEEIDAAMISGQMFEAERPHRVTVMQPVEPVVRDKPIPNEWMLIAPDTVELDEAVCIGDKEPVTISDMVALGFDRAELEVMWSGTDASTSVSQARDTERSQKAEDVGQRNGVNRRLWLIHQYPLFDLDGDGIAERLHVRRIGNHVLSVEPVAEQPYSGWSPMPMQHRFTGQSIYDKTADVQRIRTVLLRQGLDGIYLSNAPRTLVNEDNLSENTIDDLLTVRAGGLIRYKGAMPPTPYVQGDTSTISFSAMEMMSAERESRTGVTRQSQGMNPDTTNKTFGGMAMLQANADQIELYVTRNMAEQLVAPMFMKRYRLMRANLSPFKMKIEGKYTLVDPSKWPEDPDMQINVGLGSGNKDQRIAYRRELMGYQAEAMGAGLRIVTEQEAYNSIKGFVDDTGLGVASDYVIDPSELGAMPDKPDPAMVEVQGKQAQAERADQLKAMQLANGHELSLQAGETDRAVRLAQAEADAEIKRGAAELEAQLRRDKAAEEARLAESRMAFEMDLARRRAEFDMELARKKSAAANDDTSIPAYRPGGDLAQ